MSLDKVKKYFKEFNIDNKIIELEESSATVAAAALAIGCEKEEIAKTLSFYVNDKAILIVMAGDAKIDNTKYKEQFKTKAKMLAYEDVDKLIGHPVGGVCPFAINSCVEVYLDESLKRFKYVYPACGSENSAIKLTLDELEKYSNYLKWIDVNKNL